MKKKDDNNKPGSCNKLLSVFVLFQITMRNYKRQTDRGQFTRQQMQDAVTAVLAGGSLRTTAARFDVNYKTLQRYARLQKNEGSTDSASFGYKTENK